MTTKALSEQALSVIDKYLHFKIGSAECSVPYFNNKTIRARAALRSTIGKGSPDEILEEIKSIMIKDHVDQNTINAELLKKTLTDNNIGIDCSALAYYILNAELYNSKKEKLSKKIIFTNCRGIIGKIRCSIRPIENCNVATLANEKNSQTIRTTDVKPGDMITMIAGSDNNDRDHILIIHQVEYQDSIPTKIHYTHAIAYPEDGIYGSGIRQGVIEITNPDSVITKQMWTENGMKKELNQIYIRAQNSNTSLKRLRVFTGN